MFLTYQEDNQLSVWWDLSILNKDEFENLKIRVESVTAPFLKLEVERKNSGETFFKNVQHPENITLTIRESTSFSTYKFFNGWLEKFYDSEKRVFKTFTSVTDYELNLFDLKLTYYKGPRFNVGFSVLGVDVLKELGYNPMKPSYSFTMTKCKIIGIDDLNPTYDSGNALIYSITILPEAIKFNEEITTSE